MKRRGGRSRSIGRRREANKDEVGRTRETRGEAGFEALDRIASETGFVQRFYESDRDVISIERFMTVGLYSGNGQPRAFGV